MIGFGITNWERSAWVADSRRSLAEAASFNRRSARACRVRGKRTLTEQLPPAPVQRRSDVTGGPGENSAKTQEVAARGVSGPGGPLPHGDRIAASFGPDHANAVHGIAHAGRGSH